MFVTKFCSVQYTVLVVVVFTVEAGVGLVSYWSQAGTGSLLPPPVWVERYQPNSRVAAALAPSSPLLATVTINLLSICHKVLFCSVHSVSGGGVHC